ncbi:hypothetical protein GBF38_012702 [Nibea albiflora]|uniref:Uncharacterized protein n=1 Tax=Nibea albiflora TaxID=240163 RepID=A0ACB7EKA8_NIBAL|nr:hypothetical protein GBF38_012702 [Nibea albiflora]
MSHEPAEESKSDADLALHNLSAEQEVEDITIPHQNAFEEEISERDLNELDPQLSVQSCVSLNLKLSTEREAPPKITSHDDDCDSNMQHESISNAQPHEPKKEAKVSEGMLSDQQETISPAPALESAEGNLPQRTTEPPSFWKRVRHFLGLRKPQRWKRRREGEER